MREFWFWVARLLLLILMSVYLPVLLAVNAFAEFMKNNLDALELESQLASAERRSKKGSKTR